MDNFFFYFAITGRDWNLYILCGDREENEFVFYVYATIYSMCQKWISIYLYNVSIAIMNWDLR